MGALLENKQNSIFKVWLHCNNLFRVNKKVNRKHPKACCHLFFVKFVLIYNLGQKIGDKFTKLRKIGFSMECVTADFLQFFTKKRQNLAFGWPAGNSPSNPSILGIFFKFPNFLRSCVLSCSETREATLTFTFW